MSEIVENGPWRARREDSTCSNQYEIFIESEDFTHDVRLIVDGDFEGADERFAYAEEIARRLNLPAAERREPLNVPERSLPVESGVVDGEEG